MIHIVKDSRVKDDPTLRVAVPTGDYNETDLIECYRDGVTPKTPVCMYQAQYVAFGGTIYHQSEELTDEQVKALLRGEAIDKVINNRKMIDGKIPAAKFEGRVVKVSGPIGVAKLRKDLPEDFKTKDDEQVTEEDTELESDPDSDTKEDSQPVPDDEPEQDTQPELAPDDSMSVPHSEIEPNTHELLPEAVPAGGSIKKIKPLNGLQDTDLKVDEVLLEKEISPVSVSRYKKISTASKKTIKKKKKGFWG